MSTKAKVLVIEDSATLRDLVLQILLVENYDVRTAPDGEAGLAMVREFMPDLVLCDISMPRMTGHDVLRAFRADPATATTPFIFLTAKAERSDVRFGMDLGADDYLTKPFDTEELLAAVRTRLRKREAIKTTVSPARSSHDRGLSLGLPNEARAPLASILGLAELLAGSDLTLEDRRSIVAEILASGRRLERTLGNLLLHLELELAEQSAQRARSIVGHKTAAVKDTIIVVAKAKSAEYSRAVSVSHSAEDLTVKMESALLQKALEELLDNALRFSGEDQPVEVKSERDHERIIIEVADRGAGLTAEQLARFKTSRKADHNELRQQGLGLGVSIVQHLAGLHGGALCFAARAGGGSVVKLKLPRAVAS